MKQEHNIGKSADPQRLRSEREAASFLGMSADFLRKDRQRAAPRIAFIKIGRAVRYDVGDLVKYMSACRRGG